MNELADTRLFDPETVGAFLLARSGRLLERIEPIERSLDEHGLAIPPALSLATQTASR